jgi:cytochrome oxidase Cu insertion factor (SCO1/SenC/PrrC family)
MNAKRVLAPVLMIAVCLVILASFKVAAVGEPTPSPTSAPVQQSSPSPTPQRATTAAPTPPQESPSSIPAIGETAPDFSLPSVSGEPVILSSYRGESNVVLLFYRTGS